MPSDRKVSDYSCRLRRHSDPLRPSRALSGGLVHLSDMDTTTLFQDDLQGTDGLGAVLSMSQLARHLGVSVQTLYDLRHQGRGPVGFRVGRELRFRVSEVEAWLLRLESADAARHPEDSR